jgi:hypothetical protein
VAALEPGHGTALRRREQVLQLPEHDRR